MGSMKASELRLGNLCQNKQGNVIHINVNHLIILSYGIENEFKPIPLTEEWLLRFGFKECISERYCDRHEEYEECTYYYYDMFKLYYNPELGCFTDDTFEYQFKLKHVYQLQNLYFALTGEELTLNK